MTSTTKRFAALFAVGAGLMMAAPAQADAAPLTDAVPDLPPVELPPLPNLLPPPGTGFIDDILNPFERQ